MPNPPQEREDGSAAGPASQRAHVLRTPVAALVAVLAVVVALSILFVGGVLTGALPTSLLPGGPAPSTTPGAGTAASGAVGPSASPTGSQPGGAPTPAPSDEPSNPARSAAPTATPDPSPTMDPERLANLLDGRLADLQRRAGIPGVSVAIVWDDGRRWLGAAGSADIATGAPMTTGTGFAFASVSKTLTAAVVLQLVEEGTLSLDQTVAPLLPTYRLDRRITVRMLLDHTSGLPDFFLNPKIDKPLQAKPDAVWTPQRTWTFVIAKRPVPGTVWQYSNSNYLLLGELVKAVTGRTLANEIRDRLLDPLALETAWYQAAEEPRVGGATGYRTVAKAGGAIRYVAVAPASGIMPFRSVVTAAGGAGSIAATALDAARWMGAFAGGSILAPDMQAAMIDDAARTSALGSRIPYGLGIQVVTLDGRRALGHSGRYLGFRNTVMYVPEARLSIAVLTNQGTYNPATIAAALMPIVSRRPSVAPIPAPSSPAPSVAPSDAPIPQPSAAAP